MSDIEFTGYNYEGTKKEKINFYVPDFFKYATLYCMLADFIEHIPQWFYEDVKISAVYGSFPNCIWNGGRANYGAINRPIMQQTIEELNKRGIAVRYTFTNPLLEEKHMSDVYSNICLELADNGKNEVLGFKITKRIPAPLTGIGCGIIRFCNRRFLQALGKYFSKTYVKRTIIYCYLQI